MRSYFFNLFLIQTFFFLTVGCYSFSEIFENGNNNRKSKNSEENLFPTPVPTYTPAPSELSGMVVFTGYINYPTPQIFLVKLDTQEIAQLTDTNLGAFGARWSPDGRKIVFLSGNNSTNIILMDVYTLEQEVLMDNDSYNGQLDWSPDGQKIVFVSNMYGSNNIFTIDLITKKVFQLTNNSFNNGYPKWSSDGKKIIFVSNMSPGGGIYLMEANGANVVKLTQKEYVGYTRPVWCPDDTCIIYEESVGQSGIKLRLLNLITMKEATLLEENGILLSESSEWYASKSHKRGYILFWSLQKDKSLLYAFDIEHNKLYSLGLYGAEADLYP